MDSVVCKIVVLESKHERALKPRRSFDDNFKSTKTGSIKRCLFGVPDPCDTDKMVQEQLETDRKRFIDRFGIDLKEVERVETVKDEEEVEVDENSCPQNKRRRILRGLRKMLRPVICSSSSSRSPGMITDVYQTKKAVQSGDTSGNEKSHCQ
ncbi:unnamed protein product [Acanthoscelides obtectus]|uniref:Uncharacterized protein n=1 Tax=Acanthoscelides obtectus TaxID=200917 RepID=A0A9P0P8T1_ACAOB|nr:unnamed protein product [Acanthoscelides obtectus]CAK1631766.1 hypothetical protein AOBTE_LOCUS7143 [Acanthoscelides obtectus]